MFSKLLSQAPVINATSDLAFLIQKETIARLVEDKLDCPANVEGARVTVVQGRKYIKLIVGTGVRYFVDLNDGTIYASASRNAPNFNRSFGTVFTINDFNWGAYEAVAKPGTSWEMTPTRGGYMTAIPIVPRLPDVDGPASKTHFHLDHDFIPLVTNDEESV